jgi:hypothetical protein
MTSPTSAETFRSPGKRMHTLSAPANTNAATANQPVEVGVAFRATAWPPKKD